MIHILDTGPLVAAFRRRADKDPFTPWVAKVIRSLPYPLFKCDAVLTEVAHFLYSADTLLKAMELGFCGRLSRLHERTDEGMQDSDDRLI